VEWYGRVHFSLADSRMIGGHLAAARRATGISAGSLAWRLRVADATIGEYEAGRTRLPVRVVFAAARALGVSPYQLLLGRSDRVVNPWGPRLLELRSVRRGAKACMDS
jgi:transcriptional regulator with XRE-family HTH domain